MKEIKSVNFMEENLLNLEQITKKSAKRLPPSGSGSGDGSTRVIKGKGEVHLTPTNYSVGDYSWDFEGGAKWKASANLVFSNGFWVLDTLSVSLSGSASVSVSGHSSQSSEVEYVSSSGGVTMDPLSCIGADASGSATVVVGGSKKDRVSGKVLDSYSKELTVSISFKIDLAAGGTALTADLGTISVG